jgi:peptidoglycan-associated lipoprotein
MATPFGRRVRIAAAVLLGLPACSSTPKPGEGRHAGVLDAIGEQLLAAAGQPGDAARPLPPLHFETDRAELAQTDRARLAEHAAWLAAHPEWALVIEGHADERGSEGYNLALGERRAAAAAAYLAEQGIDPARLLTHSRGEAAPAIDAHDESAWRANRRAELRVAKL